MTEPTESADLTAAKAQFLEAERRLRELAQGAVELTRASVLLKKARMGLADGSEGLRDLSERLSHYIESLAGLTTQLAAVADGLEKGVSELSAARFDRIDKQMAAHQSGITGLAETERAMDERLATIQAAITQLAETESGHRQRLLTVQAAITGVDAAESGNELGLLPGLEKSLMALAQDIYSKEVTMVDMLAELRRSLGDEISSNQELLVQRVDAGSARELTSIRRLLWLIVGLLGALGLLVFVGL